MALLSILVGGAKGSTIAMLDQDEVEIRDLAFDAVTQESHQIGVQVSEHPLETGASVADHIRRLPDQLQIEGLFSNTPVSLFDASQRLLDGEAHTVRALGFFEELASKKRLCNLSNRFKSYRNMVCTGVSFTRGSGRGDAVGFSASFRQLLFAKTEIVTGVAASNVTGLNSTTRDQGKLAASTPSPETQAASGSFLARFFGIGG